MIKSKKAMLFNISLVIITIVVLTTAFVALGQTLSFRGGIGGGAFDIVRTYQRGENRLFYVDQAAKLSVQQAAYDLARKGGVSNETRCGSYEGYAVWINATNECYPEYNREFKRDFNRVMRNYLSFLPLYANYEISFIGNKFIGAPHSSTTLHFFSGTSLSNYTIYPSFNVQSDYDINVYNDLIEKSNNLISECETAPCVNNKAAEFEWTVAGSGQNLFKFNYESDKTVFVKNAENRVSYEPIIYKFALYVPLRQP